MEARELRRIVHQIEEQLGKGRFESLKEVWETLPGCMKDRLASKVYLYLFQSQEEAEHTKVSRLRAQTELSALRKQIALLIRTRHGTKNFLHTTVPLINATSESMPFRNAGARFVLALEGEISRLQELLTQLPRLKNTKRLGLFRSLENLVYAQLYVQCWSGGTISLSASQILDLIDLVATAAGDEMDESINPESFGKALTRFKTNSLNQTKIALMKRQIEGLILRETTP